MRPSAEAHLSNGSEAVSRGQHFQLKVLLGESKKCKDLSLTWGEWPRLSRMTKILGKKVNFLVSNIQVHSPRTNKS
jgi:hypothetical protein